MPDYKIDRRAFLRWAGGSAVGLLVPAPVFATQPAASGAHLTLHARAATVPIAASITGETATRIWGYNGTIPGPTIRCRKGDRVKVRLVNELDQPTTIHWHGIRIDNAMDGVTGLTQDAVQPGGSFDYDFVAPESGSYWYHTHNRSWEQMARGLYGLMVVEDDEDPAFDRDIYLAIDDWRLKRDGQLEVESLGNLGEWAHGGRMGNWLTVNGRSNPQITVRRGERLRLRLANTANSRIFRLRLNGQTSTVIALDGRAITPGPNPDTFDLAPAQRVDLLVDVDEQAADQVVLEEVSGNSPYPAARLDVQPRDGDAGRAGTAFSGLALPADQARPDVASAITTDLVMSGGAMGRMDKAIADGKMRGWRELAEMNRVWAFNGVAGDMDSPLVAAKLGQTVVLNISNETAWPHGMHLHGQHFQVIGRNRQSVRNPYWRDTELMGPEETMSIAFVADNPGKWLFHCHMLEHQAGGMVTWIDVV